MPLELNPGAVCRDRMINQAWGLPETASAQSMMKLIVFPAFAAE